ncbi:MAG: hypothetical protein GX442_26770, partial [Candidatus Riflebacteria bacterium]|nr:hypothetical protein [Candidatus Riflebacteria bacterium]
MVTKRQQDLIIQNLKSISAEIRLKSLQQVSTLLSVPEPDKIKYYQAALQDSEEAVRKMAQRLLGSLDQAGGQPVDHAPASPGPAPQPAPASPEAADPAAAFVPDAGSGPAEPS